MDSSEKHTFPETMKIFWYTFKMVFKMSYGMWIFFCGIGVALYLNRGVKDNISFYVENETLLGIGSIILILGGIFLLMWNIRGTTIK
jgi:hypothetical protein